jgi:hypothetical protein
MGKLLFQGFASKQMKRRIVPRKATDGVAYRWFAENDPEGVAFEYPIQE